MVVHDGTYIDVDGKGELHNYKRFAGVNCGGNPDELDNYGKVFVSKANEFVPKANGFAPKANGFAPKANG